MQALRCYPPCTGKEILAFKSIVALSCEIININQVDALGRIANVRHYADKLGLKQFCFSDKKGAIYDIILVGRYHITINQKANECHLCHNFGRLNTAQIMRKKRFKRYSKEQRDYLYRLLKSLINH